MTSVVSANERQCISYSCGVRSIEFNMSRLCVCLQHCQDSRTHSEILKLVYLNGMWQHRPSHLCLTLRDENFHPLSYTFSTLVKLQPLFLRLQLKTCLRTELQPWFLRLQWKTCPWTEHMMMMMMMMIIIMSQPHLQSIIRGLVRKYKQSTIIWRLCR